MMPGWLRPFLPYIAGGVVLAVVALLVWIWRLDHLRAEYRQQLAACEIRNARQVADWQAEYNRAVEAAQIAKNQKEAEYENARADSATRFTDLSDRYRTAVMRLTARAHSGGTGAADLPGDADAAGLPVDAAEGATVSVRIADVEICAANTAYAQAAHEWAITIGGAEPAR